MLVNWQDLDIEKSSMLGVVNGKYIKFQDRYYHPFMICYGNTRTRVKLVLIEEFENNYKEFSCVDEAAADKLGFDIITCVVKGVKIIDIIKDEAL